MASVGLDDDAVGPVEGNFVGVIGREIGANSRDFATEGFEGPGS